MINFKDALIRLRKTHGLTQDDLAKIVGVSRGAIANYEKGIREPSFETLEKLADYFNVSMSELLDDDLASRLLKYYSELKPLIDLASSLDNTDLAKLEERAAMLLEQEKYNR